MRSNSVVLPAPLGPMMPTISPGATAKRHVVDGPDAAERPGEARDLERRDRTASRRRTAGPSPTGAVRPRRRRGRRRRRPGRRPAPRRRSRSLGGAAARPAAAPSRNTDRSTSGRSSSSAVGPWKRISPFSMKYASSASVERDVHRLLDEDDRGALVADAAHDLEELLDDHRRQAERQLVDQQQLGPRQERHGQRQHLLLAARQVGGRVVEPLGAATGNSSSTSLGALGHERARRRRSIQPAARRFSATVSDGNMPWPPGTSTTPRGAISWAGA